MDFILATITCYNSSMSFINFIKIIHYIVWSVVGIGVIILMIVAYQQGPENIYKTFFDAAKNAGFSLQSSTQSANTAQNASTSVTPEQLSCIQKAIGKTKTDAVVAGTAQLSDAEKQQIQPCLATTQNTPSNSIPVSNGGNTGANLQQPVSP